MTLQINASQSEINVRACKYDGRVHRSWAGRLREHRGSLIVLDAEFAEEVRHPLLGTIAPGTLSTEYYWTDRWYNVFRFAHPNGRLRNYYCNINRPAVFDDTVLSFVDLDMDVLVAPDYTYSVLDTEEFAINAAQFEYPEDVC
nr:DUF402 domain-containing protein [Pyrinomonadaceae bacterium]